MRIGPAWPSMANKSNWQRVDDVTADRASERWFEKGPAVPTRDVETQPNRAPCVNTAPPFRRDDPK
jgi:hypothetical protein